MNIRYPSNKYIYENTSIEWFPCIHRLLSDTTANLCGSVSFERVLSTYLLLSVPINKVELYMYYSLGSVSSLNNFKDSENKFSWKYEAKGVENHHNYCMLQFEYFYSSYEDIIVWSLKKITKNIYKHFFWKIIIIIIIHFVRSGNWP
jgi:hypothetical protein